MGFLFEAFSSSEASEFYYTSAKVQTRLGLYIFILYFLLKVNLIGKISQFSSKLRVQDKFAHFLKGIGASIELLVIDIDVTKIPYIR